MLRQITNGDPSTTYIYTINLDRFLSVLQYKTFAANKSINSYLVFMNQGSFVAANKSMNSYLFFMNQGSFVAVIQIFHMILLFIPIPSCEIGDKSFYNPIQLLASRTSIIPYGGSLQVSTSQATKRIEAVGIIRFIGAREVSSGKVESEVEN